MNANPAPDLRVQERIPEPEFLKLCMERDMKMIGECLVEAGHLEKRAFKFSRLEGKLLRRAEKMRRRIRRAVNLNITNSPNRTPEGLVARWTEHAANRRHQANCEQKHSHRCISKAAKLRGQAARMQSNVERCATRRRYLLV